MVGRFRRIAKARDKRRVSRVPVNVNDDTVEGLNKAVENAVRANLAGGMTTFRRDVAKMQLDVAFNAQDYRALRQTKAWAKAEQSLSKAAAKLSGIVPQTQAHVLRGAGRGTSGSAKGDSSFTRPINFDEAFGRKPERVRVPKPAADPLERRMDATNPRIARHTQKRMQDYLSKLTLPTQKNIQDIIAQNVKSTKERSLLVRQALRPQPAQALSFRIGLQPRQINALDRLEETMAKAGQSQDQINGALRSRSDKMLQQRAELIAVTEARAASGNAQVEAWLAMQEQGMVGPNAQKVWHLAWEEACANICRKVDGVMVPLADEWTMGDGSKCYAAGSAHVACRCMQTLYDPDVDDDVTTADGKIPRNADAFVPEGHRFDQKDDDADES